MKEKEIMEETSKEISKESSQESSEEAASDTNEETPEDAADEIPGKPIIEITSCPIATANKKMVIAGNINSAKPDLQLFINSDEHKILGGRFMASLPLEEGPNDFDIVLVNKTQTLAYERRMIFCGFLPPALKVDDIPDVTPETEIMLSGTAHDINQLKSILTLKINGEVIEISPDGSWFNTYVLKEGSNVFDIVVVDGALRKSVHRKAIEHHPKAPEIVFEGIGPIITKRQIEIIGHLRDFDFNKMDIRIHDKSIPVVDGGFRYMTNIRTDKAEIPIRIDLNGRPLLSFSRLVIFAPSPPTITVDDEVKPISPTHCRISGTISDENDIDPKLFVNGKELFPRGGVWTATLALKPGINSVVLEGRNQSGLKKVITKKLYVSSDQE